MPLLLLQHHSTTASLGSRQLIGKIPTRSPAKIHSFALTPHYIVHVEFPLRVNPIGLCFGNIPYINCYRWQPELNTEFTVLDRRDGTIEAQYEWDALLALPHVNAYETGNDIIVVMAAKPDASIIDDLYIANLRGAKGRPVHAHSNLGRFVLAMKSDSAKTQAIKAEILSESYIELLPYIIGGAAADLIDMSTA